MFLKNISSFEYEYVIIEKDLEKVESGVKEGFNIINEDASRYDVIKKFDTEVLKSYPNSTLVGVDIDKRVLNTK